jgi:hypothetical protein
MRAGLFTAVVFTNVVVSALKSSVGRPRPDFASRCFPDGKAVRPYVSFVIQQVFCVDQAK